MYCNKCKIEYSGIESDGYVEECPLCNANELITRIQYNLKSQTDKLQVYQICEQCKSELGACDKDIKTCYKLQHLFNCT